MVGYELLPILGGVVAATAAVANSARTVTPYAFLMAKIRAWEARMIGDAKAESLADSASLPALISGLRGTDYEPDMETIEESSEAIEAAANRHLFRAYDEVFQLLPKDALAAIRKFAERLDLGNLRLVVQVASGRVERKAALSYLMDGMIFSKDRLEVMASSESVQTLIEQLSETEYYQDLIPYLEPGEYEPSELMRAMEHSFYRSLWRATEALGRKNRRIAKNLIGMEIDLANVKMIFRLRSIAAAPDIIMKNVIPIDANLSEETYRECAQADSLERMTAVLSGSSLREILRQLLSIAGDRVAEVERLADEALLNFSKAVSLMNPLTIATPLAYLYEKHAEVRNIRTLARGIGDGLGSAALKELLVRCARIE